jgi:hypothetical protein
MKKNQKNTLKMLSLVFKNSLKWTRHCREGREQPSPQARWLTNPKGKASNAMARFYPKKLVEIIALMALLTSSKKPAYYRQVYHLS